MRLLGAGVVLAALVATAMAEPKIEHTMFELPNGLRVYVIEDHQAPVVDEIMWVRVGSKDELPHRTGFAHLFEHLMFKGSAHLPDGLMDRLLEEAGGYSTAFTSTDATVYTNVAGSNFFERMMWIEADRLAGLTETIDVAKLDNQRSVVLNERRRGLENQPYGLTELFVSTTMWPKQFGYHWSTIGYVADLKAASVPDVKAFFTKYYVPNNITMVIAGDVKPDEVKRVITKYFAWLPRAQPPKRPTYTTPLPLTKQVTIDSSDDVQASRVTIAYRGPKEFDPDEPAVDVAVSILAGGKSSRLYRRLVFDAKLAQDVDAGSNNAELGSVVEIVVTAKPGVDASKLSAAITEEIAKLAATPPDAKEVERAANVRERRLLGRLERLDRRAIQLARYDVHARDADYFAKDLARYRAVTPAQVTAAVKQYLKPTARLVLTIKPGQKPTTEPQ